MDQDQMKAITSTTAAHIHDRYLSNTFTYTFPVCGILLTILLFPGILTYSFGQAGVLDQTFGSEGIVSTAIGEFGESIHSVLIRDNGNILVGGYTQDSFTSSDFALVQYKQDGSLDSTFGSNGIVKTPIEAQSKGNAVLVQDDGKILMGGSSKWYLNLVRYMPDGHLDTTFGSAGIVITDLEGYYRDQCNAIAVQKDGKIVIGGYSQHFSNDMSYLFLLRYHPDGSIDSTFGTNGVVIGSTVEVHSMLIQDDGNILLGGKFNSSFALLRYNNTGILDSTFGSGGSMIHQVGSYGGGYDLGIQADGKILLGGTANSSFAVARYHIDGRLDSTFGSNGSVIGHAGKGYSLQVQGDGKILLGGASNSSFALERYLSDGSLDPNFGTAGIVITSFEHHAQGNALGIQSDGKIVLGGYQHTGANIDMTLVRYDGEANVGIQEICCEQHMRIFPNPFHSSATIQFSKPLHQASLRIFNVQGQQVRQINHIDGQEIQFFRAGLPTGIYLLYLTEKDAIISAGRCLIEDH